MITKGCLLRIVTTGQRFQAKIANYYRKTSSLPLEFSSPTK